MQNIHLKHCKMDIKKKTCRFTFVIDYKDSDVLKASGSSTVYFQMIYKDNTFSFPQKENCSNLWVVEKGDIVELPEEVFLKRSLRVEAKAIGRDYIDNLLKKQDPEQGKYNLSVHGVEKQVSAEQELNIPFQKDETERG